MRTSGRVVPFGVAKETSGMAFGTIMFIGALKCCFR
jgi:hypothetical protein